MKNKSFALRLVLILCACLSLNASAPQWWVERGVSTEGIDESSVTARTDNYSGVNQGQLMHMAKQAAAELDSKSMEGAGAAILTMVEGFHTYSNLNENAAEENIKANYNAINIGQLKAVAKPFYDRLWEIENAYPQSVTWPSGISFDDGDGKYPWPVVTEQNKKENYTLANIGQVKFLFSWDVNLTFVEDDEDGDGVPDSWGNEWNPEMANVRFLKIETPDGNIKMATDGEQLELLVRVTDERGLVFPNAPLFVSPQGGSIISGTSAVTGPSGECLIEYIANFANDVSQNSANVSISSQYVFGSSANFTIKKKIVTEDPAINNSFSERKIDGDPSPLEESDGYMGTLAGLPIKVTESRTVFRDKRYFIPNGADWPCYGHGYEPEPEGSGTYEKYGASTFYILDSLRVGNPSNPYDVCNICGEYKALIIPDEERSSTYRFSYDQSKLKAQQLMGRLTISSLQSRMYSIVSDGLTMYTPSHVADYEDQSFFGRNIREYSPGRASPPRRVLDLYYYDTHEYETDTACREHFAYCGQSYTIEWRIKPWVSNIKIKDFNGFGGGHVGTIRSFGSIGVEGGDDIELTLSNATNVSLQPAWDPRASSLSGNPDYPARGVLTIKNYEMRTGASYGWGPEYEDINYSERILVSTDTYLIEIDPPDNKVNFSIPTDESAGPRYRKISLSGRPMSDDKPQSEDEDDVEPLDTYIDALSLSLRHDVVDASIKVPASDMAISLRRNYKPLTWNFKGGLRPHERPENVFGGNWSANIISYACIDAQILENPSSRTSPDTATVVDENGSAFSYALFNRAFYPMPSGRSDQQAYLNTLSARGAGLVLDKRFGTKVTYEPAAISIQVSSDRIMGSKSKINHSYYRAQSVEDRYGNKIIYQYPRGIPDTLIPEKIYLEGREEIAITIEQKDGYISKIWDAEGNCTEYSYGTFYGSQGMIPDRISQSANFSVKSLTAVRRNGVYVARYGYTGITGELDAYSLAAGKDPHYNFNLGLSSITDATNQTYSFLYGGSLGLYSYDIDADYYEGNSKPKPICGVIGPNRSIASFSSDSEIKVQARLVSITSSGKQNYTYSLPSKKRSTIVTDADGNSVVYNWTGATVEIVEDFASLYGIKDWEQRQKFDNPAMVYFTGMSITHYNGALSPNNIIGSESFSFNIGAGMSLASVVDFSGNRTEYSYTNVIAVGGESGFITYAGLYSDPNAERKYVHGSSGEYVEKTFTYSPNYRIMSSESVTDSRNPNFARITQWQVDRLGRRTDERVYHNADTEVQPEKVTVFEYDENFKGFLKKTTLVDAFGAGNNMVTLNIPDANGRIASNIVDPGGLNLETKFSYNRNGRRTLATDPNGNSTHYEYDNFNRLVRVTNPDASLRQIVYDAAGRKIEEILDKEASGDGQLQTLYGYNPNGLLNKTQIVMDRSPNESTDIITRTQYSNAGKILKTTDANGYDTVMKYDGLGRLVKMIKYEGSGDVNANPSDSSAGVYVTKYKYEGNCGSGVFSTDNFKPSEVTDARGNTSKFEHDAWYRETVVILPYGENGSVTRYKYDAVGNRTSETDAKNNITTFEYDALNNLVKTTFADSSTKRASYGKSGVVLTETDEMNNVTSHAYDNAGRKVSTTFPQVYDGMAKTVSNPIEKYAYDANGNMIAKWDATNRQFNTVYDSRNRVVAELAPAVEDARQDGKVLKRPTTINRYDLAGNVVETIDANGNATLFDFNNAGRVTRITFPKVADGTGGTLKNPTEHMLYDGNGNIVSKINPRGIVTDTTYNSFNKPLVVTKNAAAEVNGNQKIIERYAYDNVGNLDMITDGRGSKTKYYYDAQNRRTNVVYGFEDPHATRTDEYEYDELNMTTRKGVPLEYDRRNRVVLEGDGRTYTYDACGRITNVSEVKDDMDVSVSYSYDDMGKILAETNSGKTHNYIYDLAGRQVLATFNVNCPSGTHSLATFYDAAGRINLIRDQKGRYTRYAYDLNGNVVKKTNPNGHVTLNTYDSLNRLGKREGERLDLKYYYDLGGNVVGFVEKFGDYAMSMSAYYDRFDRLTNEMLTDGGKAIYSSYGYDKASNRVSHTLEKTGPSFPVEEYEENNYSVNALNQIVSISNLRTINDKSNDLGWIGDTSGSVSFFYNARGNTTSINDGTKLLEFEYDSFDMLAKTKVNGALKTSNVYDYRGRRVKHTSSNDVTLYHYSGGTGVSQTKTTNGTSKTTLMYRGSDMGGGVGGINYAEYSDGTDLNYKFYNLRGDVIMTLDKTNNVKATSVYTAFGTHDDTGSINTDSHRANTKVEDADGLLNEGKRFRSLEYGIFLTPDPLEYVDGLNSYIYVNQNPWGRFDPLGLATEEAEKKKEQSKKQTGDDAGTAMRKYMQALHNAMRSSSPKAAAEAEKEFNEACDEVKNMPSQAASGIADNVPVARSVKSAIEFATGEDVFTGEEIDRESAALGLAMSAVGKGGAAKSTKKAKKNAEKANSASKVKERKTKGRDGSTSKHVNEQDSTGKTTSKKHVVENEKGEITHQHQEHIGKHGSERRFSDELTGTETKNAPSNVDTGPRFERNES